MAPDDETNVDVTDREKDETTHEITQTEKPGLVDILGAELRALAMEEMSLRKKLDTAKTTPKKNLLKKKIKKNSKKAAEIVLYLERIQIGKAVEESRQQQEFIDERNNDGSEQEQVASS